MGRVMFGGGKPGMVVPSAGILASDLAVGSSVYLMENGTAVEYLVVNQGKPSGSSLYDDSCDGTWLLRKDIYEKRQWHSSNNNSYGSSAIHSYLNNTFFALLDSNVQNTIKQFRIPYRYGGGDGTTIYSGANGLVTKIFLLSGTEVNWTSSTSMYIPDDGACLSYFSGCSTTDSKRIGYLNGSATDWWLRSPLVNDTDRGATRALRVSNTGNWSDANCSSTFGIRPALVLPYNALFDPKTLILKGVA